MNTEILAQNRRSWNAMSEAWQGTVLPDYGCLCPTEDDLRLMPDLAGKSVLEIGCGAGLSLKWCAQRGAGELWGLDISDEQLKRAGELLRESGCEPKLFCSPMEQDPGLPKAYFQVAYSIYAIGWTADLHTTFGLIASYLQPGGVFIFSWDHPLLHCVDAVGGELVFAGSYHERGPFTFHMGENRQDVRRALRAGSYVPPAGGRPLTLYQRRLSDYINALAAAGFAVQRVVEETNRDTLAGEATPSAGYYTPGKAKRFPCSLVIKAVKL